MANRLNVIQIVAIHAALNMDGAAIKTDIANAKIASTTANKGKVSISAYLISDIKLKVSF